MAPSKQSLDESGPYALSSHANRQRGMAVPLGTHKGERPITNPIMNQGNAVRPDPLGGVTIGAEHRVQIGLVRALCKALEEGDRDGNAAEILSQLEVYTSAHFLGEQLLMRLHSYDDYERHCQEHDKLMQLLASAKQGFELQSLDEQLTSFRAFEDRITSHIAGSDDALERFVSLASQP